MKPGFIFLLLALCLRLPAYIRDTTSTGNYLRRADYANLVFKVNQNTTAGMTNTDGQAMITAASDPLGALQAAMNTWSGPAGTALRFAPLQTTTAYNDPSDATNVFVFRDTASIRSLVGSALAITMNQFYQDGTLIDGDIIFNPKIVIGGQQMPFSTNLAAGSFDLQSIATHELGHALGADHSGFIAATMFQSTPPVMNYQAKLSSDDIAFVTDAYPASGIAASLGTISGRVTMTGGSAVLGALVVAVSPSSGISVGGLTSMSDGSYAINRVPPGPYQVYAEPLDGPVYPANIDLSGSPTVNFTPGFAGGATPSLLNVTAGTTTIADIAVNSGASSLDILYLASGSVGGSGDANNISSAVPIVLTPGQSIDILLFGPGLNTTVTDVRLLAPGVSLRSGSLRADPLVNVGGYAALRMTADVAANAPALLGSIVAVKGSGTAVLSGALVIPSQGNAPPAVVSATPASGSGSSQTFGFLFSDPNGGNDIATTSVLINTTVNGSGACFIIYNRAANAVFLVNDGGSGSTRVDFSTSSTAQNSQCSLSGLGSSLVLSGNTLQLNLAITFKAAFAGTKNLYASAQDSAGLSTGFQTVGSWTVTGAPYVVSANPASGAGSSGAFTFVFGDPNGYTDLAAANVLINADLNGANACFLSFDRAANAVYLINDNGAGSARVALGTAQTAQNSQCRVNGAGSSAAGSGNSLNLTLNLAFLPTFVGLKTLYGYAQDASGQNSGFQSVGSWTVTSNNVAPVAVSVAPSSGAGAGQSFTFTFSDANGFGDIAVANALINAALDGRNACFLSYNRAANTVYLINDAGNASTAVALGSTTTAQNSQCSIAGASSSAAGGGNTLTLNLSLSFKPAVSGPKSIFGYAQDNGGLNSGFQTLGSYTVTSSGNSAPSAVSVTPSSGSSSSASLQVLFSDPNGYTDIRTANVLINSAIDGKNACFLSFDRAANTVYLINDAGDASTAVGLGSGTTAQNSQCSVSGSQSSATGSGNNLTLTLVLTFKTAFMGPKTIYGYAQDAGGLASGFQALGTWNPGGTANAAPVITSVTPASGSGFSQTFSVALSDANGFADISFATVLINTSPDGRNACFIYFDRAAGAAYLVNDSGSGSSRVDLGSSATVQNSQCSLAGTTSSASGVGNTLTLNLALRFKPAFAGTKTLYVNVQDAGGLSSGTQASGTWTVP